MDDHPIVRFGVQMLLSDASEFKLLGAAASATEALKAAETLQPDLIVLDLVLGGRSGLELVPDLLKETGGKARIVIYSTLDEKIYARRALRAGAWGYVMKEHGLQVLMEAFRSVMRGESYASPGVKQELLNASIGGRTTRGQTGVASLSNQELHVFLLLGSGLSSTLIAEKLGVSPKTVGTHRERIKNKLGYHSARELERGAEEFHRNDGSASVPPIQES